ncbi:MAG: tRNA (guanosine(37)-N1)-methyltransferase TrmD [Lachnospiraceae bacterium]|nr:tRNA (guanosine(37)-N1)-methyltransferase TrmD [Lachnospiraceae bacterium]
MNFHILTLFPEMVENALNTSILKRAADAGIIEINAVNIRDYSTDKHKKVDDYPYGGGAGMLMQAQPVFDAYEDLCKAIKKRKKSRAKKLKVRVLYMTPQGRKFDQKFAEELAKEEDLIFLCGHYEGIDERVIEEIVTDEVSLGDFVLTGGELPAMVMVDCISRLIPGVLGSDDSASDESFSDGLLEYPQYTRPEVWQGKAVPEVLLSGNHKEIEKWRMEMSLERTGIKRPDLYEEIHSELEDFKKENPKKFKKKRSEAEEVLKMREIKNTKTKEQ